jgi:YesN/AraC family two-component response regulator
MYKAVIVDDEIWAAKDIMSIIDWEAQGFSISAAFDNGADAIKYFEAETPDILLTDIEMPGMNGLDLIGALREKGYDTITLLITAYGEFEYAKRAIEYDVLAYILKPVDERELTAALRKARQILEDIQSMQRENVTAVAGGKPKCVSVPISEIVDYIEEHYTEKLMISDFAERYFFNTSYLSNLFKKEAGMSFTNYIIGKRLLTAEKLLADNRVSLTDVSRTVGYDDYYHFSKLFKKYKGISPFEYRRKIIKQ